MTRSYDPDRWAQIRTSFDEIVDLDESDRSEKLRAISASDAELAAAVGRLLNADANAQARLARIESAFAITTEPGEDILELSGKTISHFQVIDALASGGMGVVYRAQDLKLRRSVALKFPLQERLPRRAKERFLHEARSAAALDHPNVCSVYEVGETEDGLLFIAMPLYDGETLRSRLTREHRLSIREAIDIARQIAKGLSAAHKAGIVHRDLKPANVMLLPDGTIRILDFGVAKVSDYTLTTSQMRVGTVAYMSPEQIDGRPLDGRTDLWALGVVLYEMLAGQRPFAGSSDVSIALAIMQQDPAQLSQFRPDIPRTLEETILKLVAKEPADRFESADAVIAKLGEVAIDSKEAPRPQTRRATPRFLQKPAAISGILIVLLAIVVAIIARQRPRASGATSAAQSVAVLPFETRGDTTATNIGVALADELATRLSAISALRVLNLAAMPAQVKTANLNVQKIVDGSVNRFGDQLRLTMRVTDGASGRLLLSRQFDLRQADVAGFDGMAGQLIVKGLRIPLKDAERARLTRIPTSNAQAYGAYLRGRATEIRASGGIDDSPVNSLLAAQSFYWRARELDPAFAQARARLAVTHAMIAFFTGDTTGTRLEQARIEAENAMKLERDLPDVDVALGYYWLTRRDDTRALASLQRAALALPSRSDLRVQIGSLYRRKGHWEEAAAEFDRAMQANPFDPVAPMQAAVSYSRLRRYADAIKAWDHALALQPEDYVGWTIRGHVYLRWRGTVDTLAATLRRIPEGRDLGSARTWAAVTVARIQRRPQDALPALARARGFLHDGLIYRPIDLLRAIIYREMGEAETARHYYRKALVAIKDSLGRYPDDASIYIAAGLAYAGLGEKDSAEMEARKAMQLVPLSESAYAAPAFAGDAALIYTQTGNFDAAIDLLRLLLAMPAGREVSVPLLRVDPGWDPLRKDPRFESLLAQYSSN